MSSIKSYFKFGVYAIAALLVLLQPLTVHAVEENEGMAEFYSRNDIVFYDRDDRAHCVAGQSSSLTGSDNAEKVYNFLTTTPFDILGGPMNPVQAAGVLGNFQRESGMDPGSFQGGGGPGRGLAQWGSADIPAYDRFGHPHANDVANPPPRLKPFAQSIGKDWFDLEAQLQFIKHEIDGPEGPPLVRHGFVDVKTVDEAAEIFDTAYERSGIKAMEDRKRYAREFYARFAGIESALGSCANTGPTGDFMSDDFITYSQCDQEPYGGSWGNIRNTHGQLACSVACGPTSLAMVIRNMVGGSYTGQHVTPEDTITYYNTHRYWGEAGSGPIEMRKTAENWGLRHEPFDSSELSNYREVFDNGGLIVVAGRGGLPFYTDINHYVVVRGITADGKFRVSDPGPGRSSVDDYDIDTFISYTTRTGAHTAFYPE